MSQVHGALWPRSRTTCGYRRFITYYYSETKKKLPCIEVNDCYQISFFDQFFSSYLENKKKFDGGIKGMQKGNWHKYKTIRTIIVQVIVGSAFEHWS